MKERAMPNELPIRRPRAATSVAPLLATLALLPFTGGCVTTDDGRVQQVLNQRGFGSRYVGDTNEQYYLGIGDQFSAVDDANPEFNDLFTVRPDGVIDPRNVGEIFVAGLTMNDVEETLTRRYREFNPTARLDCQLVGSQSKWYYVDGEVNNGGRKPFGGDLTLFTVVFDSGPTLLSDDDAVELIRADPYHPLVVKFDYDDMLEGGWSLGNAEVRENDIIFVPPNTWGYITNFFIMLFSPVAVVTQAVYSTNRLVFSVDTFGDTNGFVGLRGGNFNSRRRISYVAPATTPPEIALAPLDHFPPGAD
jgi:protein involved in polysaccharide export with SLBB domain